MRTAIYCRVSTPAQKNTTSLPEQERINRAHATGLGWEVSEPHVYHEVEGGEDLYRPCMDRLWDAIMRHEVDALVVDVLDRLSRDEGDVGAVWHHCDRYGVTIEVASEDLDESEHGRNLRTLSGIMARMERVDIRRRTQRGRRARAASGKLFPASFPLYGYLWGDPAKGARSTYVMDPETAPMVVLIFERIAEGVPIRRLCHQLEAEGIPTPGQVLATRGQVSKGKTVSAVWRPGTIHRIMHHPAYQGAHLAYRWQTRAEKVRPAETGITTKRRVQTVRADGDPARVPLPASACPALVSPELAQRAQARLCANHTEWVGRPVADPLATLWRGIIVCGHCGGRLYTAQTQGTHNRRYCCRGMHADPETGTRIPCPGGAFSMSAAKLDPAGWADVCAWLTDPANVERLLADWQEKSARAAQSVGSRLASVEATIAQVRGRMRELAESIAESTKRESRRALQETLDRYADQLTADEGKRARLLVEGETATHQAAAGHGMRDWVRVVAARAASADRAQQRDTLRALGAEMTLWSADYVHLDGWPQRYRIRLRFTGFTGQAPIMLPPGSLVSILSLTSLC